MNNDPDQLKEFSQKVLERDGEYERTLKKWWCKYLYNMCSRKRENRFREENIYRNHKSFQNLKIKKILIHKVSWSTKQNKYGKTKFWHIIVKLKNTKDKNKVLKEGADSPPKSKNLIDISFSNTGDKKATESYFLNVEGK